MENDNQCGNSSRGLPHLNMLCVVLTVQCVIVIMTCCEAGVSGSRTFCLRSTRPTTPASLKSTPSSWESTWTKWNYSSR